MFTDDTYVHVGTPNGGLQRLPLGRPSFDLPSPRSRYYDLLSVRTRFMAGHVITDQAIAAVAHDPAFIRDCQLAKRDAKASAERMVQRWRAELVRRMGRSAS